MSQGFLRLIPVALVAMLLVPGMVPAGASSIEAGRSPGTSPFQAILDDFSRRADALNATVPPVYGSDPDYREAMGSFRDGMRSVRTYNQTLLHGFTLNGLAKMKAAADYIEYNERFPGYVNLPHLDAIASELRAKGNATRERYHQMEREVKTTHGFEALVYGAAYIAAGDLQLTYYETLFRNDWTKRGSAAASSVPAVYGQFVMAELAYDWANGVADLTPSLDTGPKLPVHGVLTTRARALESLVGWFDDGGHEYNLNVLARAAAARDERAYPIAARILQVRAENMTLAEIQLRADAPANSPQKIAAASYVAEFHQKDVTSRFRAMGLAAYLPAEIQAEVGHYISRGDHESLVRSVAGVAALEEIPRLLVDLFPPRQEVASKGSAVPMPTLLLVAAAVAAVAVGLLVVRGRRAPPARRK